MKLSGLLSFVNIAVVSTQLVKNQQESPGFIQNQYKRNEIHNASSARSYRNNVVGRSESRGRVEGADYDFRSNTNDDRRQRNGTDVEVNLKTDQRPKVFTNIDQAENDNKVKHIQRLNSNSQPDKIVVKDEVKYDQEPLTNRRRPEDKSVYPASSKIPSVTTPYAEKSISSVTQRESKSNGNTSVARNNVSDNRTVEGSSKINKDESTMDEIDLENRVAFTGDNCPTGQVKVEGKCVKEM